MAASPRWKIYRMNYEDPTQPKEYVAATKHLDDAINVISLGNGEIRDGHSPKRKVLCSDIDFMDVKGWRPDCRALVKKRLVEMDGDRARIDFRA